MKKIILILFFLLNLTLFSCQKEESSIIENPTENLTKVSPLTTLISRVSQNPTALDHIIDGTNLCSVKLPVTISVDNHTLTVNSRSDYNAIYSIISESNNDDDRINFIYPITLIYKNFNQIVVNNKAQLEAIKASYIENQSLNEIECVNFNYPIVLNLYNSNSELASAKTVQNDSQLYNLMDGLQESDIISISYPISITNYDNRPLVVKTNTDLKLAIEKAVTICGSNTNSELSTILTSGNWHISRFTDNNIDRTSDFTGYSCTFAFDRTIAAIKNYAPINGSWNVSNSNGNDKVNISFTGSALEELVENWSVLEYNSTNIKLKSFNNGDTHFLNFTKN